jgi:two-component system KDP operon response regulator KdpE
MIPSEHGMLSILVVEDNPGVADLLRDVFNDVDGWGASAVPDAASTLATLQQVKREVLILDKGLPGISGLELLGLLRKEDGWQHQPVIVVSAYARLLSVRQVIKQGLIREALMKPFDINQLIRIITDAITR